MVYINTTADGICNRSGSSGRTFATFETNNGELNIMNEQPVVNKSNRQHTDTHIGSQ
jgi:hypothetical protein